MHSDGHLLVSWMPSGPFSHALAPEKLISVVNAKHSVNSHRPLTDTEFGIAYGLPAVALRHQANSKVFLCHH